jgi:hypothetical protein
LALRAARSNAIDGVVGLAPGTVGVDTEALEWQRDELARLLAEAKTGRVAVFFFAGDPRESVARADTTRRALAATQSAYMIVDRPPDLVGHGAAAEGRLTRRYRDCLMSFLQREDVPSGEAHCETDRGYAVGADIRFPDIGEAVRIAPDADRRLAAFRGRWRGDASSGAYLVLEASDIGADRVAMQVGYSPAPGSRRRQPWVRSMVFTLDDASEGQVSATPWASTTWRLRVRTPSLLDVEISRESTQGPSKFVLQRQAEQAPARPVGRP